MDRLKRALIWVEFTLALFGCIYLARAFVSGRIVALVVTEANLTAIALVAAVSALVPGLPLGIGYGVTHVRPNLGRAFTVAVSASVIELAFATYSVNWWEFVSWWVLPLECATLVVCFPAAAWAGAAATARISTVARRRVAVALFALLVPLALTGLGIIISPWLLALFMAP
jgi:hypothetical protein